MPSRNRLRNVSEPTKRSAKDTVRLPGRVVKKSVMAAVTPVVGHPHVRAGPASPPNPECAALVRVPVPARGICRLFDPGYAMSVPSAGIVYDPRSAVGCHRRDCRAGTQMQVAGAGIVASGIGYTDAERKKRAVRSTALSH